MANSAVVGPASPVDTSTGLRSRAPRGLLLRVRTLLLRPWLDFKIAHGVERPGDAALALRKAQLVDGARRRLARRFKGLLAERSQPKGPSSAVPIDQRAVSVAKPVLTEIILSLLSSDAVEPRGVLLGWRLLTDPCSPIYVQPGGPSSNSDRLLYESVLVLVALRPSLARPMPHPPFDDDRRFRSFPSLADELDAADAPG